MAPDRAEQEYKVRFVRSRVFNIEEVKGTGNLLFRFAEEDGKLYRDSVGHGGMACEACHGSTHAEWPVANGKANDNVAAKQLQGHAGPIIECNTCHADGLALTKDRLIVLNPALFINIKSYAPSA
jgi:hypothetical protein